MHSSSAVWCRFCERGDEVTSKDVAGDPLWTRVKVERVEEEMHISGVAPITQAFEVMRAYEREYEVCASMTVSTPVTPHSADSCHFRIVLSAEEGLGLDETEERYLSFFHGWMSAKGWSWRLEGPVAK